MILGFTTLIFVYLVFFSKSILLGKYLYGVNNWLERRLSNLTLLTLNDGQISASFLRNNNPGKPYMLLLHGFSADKDIWLKFAKYAKKDFQLIIPDLLGHGDMPYSPEQDYSAYEQANYIAALLRYLELKGEIILVGNSMGGKIAAILANGGYSNKANTIKSDSYNFELGNLSVSKTVLLDPAGAKTDFAVALNERGHNPFLHSNTDSALNFYRLAMKKPPFMPPCVLAYVAQEKYISKQTQYKHMFSDFFNPDIFIDSSLDNINSDVVLIWGKYDGLIPVSDAKKWQDIVKCKCYIFDDLGHLPMLESPKRTYEAIGV